ncbi:hypothetical protein FACS1894106_1520 [Spirochaetia bacterium]|nr:hypothetical protein FACS1894106_1520 [Spirochaetia bacterium]
MVKIISQIFVNGSEPPGGIEEFILAKDKNGCHVLCDPFETHYDYEAYLDDKEQNIELCVYKGLPVEMEDVLTWLNSGSITEHDALKVIRAYMQLLPIYKDDELLFHIPHSLKI